MIYIVALGVGFKCPRKIHLNTQCPQILADLFTLFQPVGADYAHQLLHATLDFQT